MTPFFFAPESPRRLALVRIVLGLVLLADALFHWRYAIELYSTFGPAIPTFLRPAGTASETSSSPEDIVRGTQPGVEPILFAPIPSPRVAVVAHTLLVCALVSVTLGWHTRISLGAAFLLALWLAPLDVTATFGKHFVIALHLMCLLGFSRCGTVWSLDALGNPQRLNICPMATGGPRRLIQILICCVYVGAVITKLKSPSFANGDLLTFSLLDDHWGGGRFGMWLTTLPHAPLLMSHATLVFEIVFPILVWVPRWRFSLVCLAYLVHATMGWLLSLGIFSPVMCAALLAFLEERELARVVNFVGSLCKWIGVSASGDAATITKRQGGPHVALRSATLHLLAVAVFVAAGYAVQSTYDWYGVFGRRPLPALRELSAGEVAEMLAQRPPAWEDYIHRVELGSRFGGNQVFGSSEKFRIGQRAYVLTQMPMPHPAMELEGLLIAPNGRECARFTHHFDAGFSYAINGFELTPELPKGHYRVLLRVEDFVVAERHFELEP